MEREREDSFVDWLRGEIVRMENVSGSLAGKRVTAMREAGGVDYREAEAQSVAFQAEFENVEAARKWSGDVFSTTAARFEEKFGPQVMVFTSIFEVL